MSVEQPRPLDPHVRDALDELEKMVLDHYPDASFQVERGEDNPEGIHLIATVDLDDPDELLDVVMDRVLHFQVDKGLPVHVIPVRPLKRVMEEIGSARRPARPRMDWGAVRPPSSGWA